MYATLILLAIIGMILSFAVVKAIAAARNLLAGGPELAQQSQTKQSEQNKNPSTNEKKTSEESKTEEKAQKEDPVLKEESKRLEEHLDRGIEEYPYKWDSTFRLDEEQISGEIISESHLSRIEFENRGLADEKFYGYNIAIEDGKKISLTFAGNILATLTYSERENVYLDDSGEVKVDMIHEYITRTFPPKLSEGMLASDIAAMVETCQTIAIADGNPRLVVTFMKDRFCSQENVVKLKRNVSPKIREKETTSQRQAMERSHELKHNM